MDKAIISIIIAIIPTIASLILFFQLKSLKKRFTKLTSGFTNQNLQEIVERYVKNLDKCEVKIDMMNNEFDRIRDETAEFLRKTGLVRFQAFKDTGSDQSFCLAVLDQNNDGFIISSLHGRGFSKIYAKEIKNSQPVQHKLTDEERVALEKALSK